MSTANLETYRVESVLDAPAGGAPPDMIARGIKVFKVGKFKNSRGVQNEWPAERLQRAVDNFNTLRRTRVFPDVPVRLDHTSSVKDLVGYFHELHFDGQFLVADVLFTKSKAYDEYNAGHLRNVSLEIGQYETNDEVVYHDVVQGLAFVDIPAVEGLHQRASGDDDMAGQNENKDGATTPPATPPADPAAPATPPATAPVTPETPPAAPGVVQPVDPATPGADPNQVDQHGRVAPQTFRVRGVDVSDHAAVQAHITALETIVDSTKVSLRNGFVDDLVTGNKILATQKDDFSKHVATLTDEQFTAFRTLYDGMPAHNLFGRHDTTTDPAVAAGSDAADELAIATETVAQFRRIGKTDAFIQAQPAWATVQAAANGSK